MLRNRSLATLLTAELVSGLGSSMTFLALPWFVLVTTGSPTRMGVVLAAELIPIAVLGIPSGSVVTRLGARTTMLWSDLARAPVIAAIPILHSAGALSFPLLLGLVALTGVFSGPYFSAQRLILPELMGDDERVVAKANSVVEGTPPPASAPCSGAFPPSGSSRATARCASPRPEHSSARSRAGCLCCRYRLQASRAR